MFKQTDMRFIVCVNHKIAANYYIDDLILSIHSCLKINIEIQRPNRSMVQSAVCDKCCDEYASARFVEPNQKLTSLCRRPICSANMLHKS